jgi:hypothetical protein
MPPGTLFLVLLNWRDSSVSAIARDLRTLRGQRRWPSGSRASSVSDPPDGELRAPR